MRHLLILLTLFVLPLHAEEKKPAPANPLKGKWEVVSAKFNGAESAALKGRTIVFGDKEFSTYDGETKGRTLKYSIDAKADPKQIDIDRGTADGKGKGIYTIDKGELIICYAEPGRTGRPSSRPRVASGCSCWS